MVFILFQESFIVLIVATFLLLVMVVGGEREKAWAADLSRLTAPSLGSAPSPPLLHLPWKSRENKPRRKCSA